MIVSEVPSRELCEQLKQIGWKQEGLYWWNKWDVLDDGWLLDPKPISKPICAPTVVQMLEVLPKSDMDIMRLDNFYTVYVGPERHRISSASEDFLPCALAKIIIYLVKEGHLKLGCKHTKRKLHKDKSLHCADCGEEL